MNPIKSDTPWNGPNQFTTVHFDIIQSYMKYSAIIKCINIRYSLIQYTYCWTDIRGREGVKLVEICLPAMGQLEYYSMDKKVQ